VPARLVTIAKFSQLIEAQLSRATLVGHGIEAFIADEQFATMNPLYLNALGGVRLQVREPDAVRAVEVLAALPEEAGDDPDEEDHEEPLHRCPRCDSQYTYYQWTGFHWLLGVLFFGLPFLFLDKRWICRKCQHTWAGAAPAPKPAGSPYRRPRRSATAKP